MIKVTVYCTDYTPVITGKKTLVRSYLLDPNGPNYHDFNVKIMSQICCSEKKTKGVLKIKLILCQKK